jgi:hypothetical protein
MTTARVHVERRHFFRRPGEPTQRFVEHAPPLDEIDHPICGCTKNVAVRPAGEPDQKGQEITLVYAPIGELRPEFWLCHNVLQFSWGAPPKRSASGAIVENHEHAHFGWTRLSHHGTANPGSRSVGVGVTLPGGHFSGHLYMGNRIDVSALMNGWCPSRIVKLDALREDDLWVHDCSSGNEAMRLFSDSDESRMWKKVLLDNERLQASVGRYRSDFTEPVEALRVRVEQDEELIALATTIVEAMAPIVTGIRTTELFRLTQEVDRTIQAMTRASSQPAAHA